MNPVTLEQMQQMASAMLMNLTKADSTSQDRSGAFEDMMAKAGKDNTDASNDANTAGKQDKTAAEGTTQEKPAAQKPEEDTAKSQELNGDPNAMQYAIEMFRPEIVDISQVEAVAEVTVEVEAAAEVVVEAAPELDMDIPVEQAAEAPVVVETEAPVEDIQAPVQQQEAAPEETQRQTEDGTFQEAVQEPVQQETERPEVTSQQPVQTEDAAPEQVEAVRVDNAPETTGEKSEEDSDEQTQGEAAQLTQQPVFHDVESVPVKVAENYREVDTEAPDMDEQVADAVWQGVEDGAQHIELRLNPANLGQVTIELTRDTSGLLQVALHVVSGKAENLLNQHLDGLHAALQAYSQGQQVRIEVQRNQEAPQQQNQHQANPDGHNKNQQQHQQRQEPRQEEHRDMDFLQKLRLGLLGIEEDA